MKNLLSEGIVLQHQLDRVVVGCGPFESHLHRQPDRLGFFAPDFFLTDPRPWKHPAEWHELHREELAAQLASSKPRRPNITWYPTDRDEYTSTFRTVMQRITEGTLNKIVPMVFERGTSETVESGFVHWLLTSVLSAQPGSYTYGWWTPSSGMIGATPELLFSHLDGRRIETAAIAGTYPPHQTEQLRQDPKELAEHQTVVDDITEVLSQLGRVETKPLSILSLPDMAHLKTDIVADLDGDVGLEQLARALHPTAALGVAPRAAGVDFLRTLDGSVDRGRFGAPFGVEWPDGRAHCVVAIRNVQWNGPDVMIGAGAGVIEQSVLEREWTEIQLKHAAVKHLLDL